MAHVRRVGDFTVQQRLRRVVMLDCKPLHFARKKLSQSAPMPALREQGSLIRCVTAAAAALRQDLAETSNVSQKAADAMERLVASPALRRMYL